MNVFAVLHNVPVAEIKSDESVKETYQAWQKLKYSLTSSVAKYIIAHSLPDSVYANVRDVISRSTHTELSTMKQAYPNLKAGSLSLDGWINLSSGGSRMDIKVAKFDSTISDKKKSKVKLAPSADEKELKNEINKTVRLIASHYRKNLISSDEKNHRTSKVREMKVAQEVVSYRDSLKLKPIRASYVRPDLEKTDSADCSSGEADPESDDDEIEEEYTKAELGAISHKSRRK